MRAKFAAAALAFAFAFPPAFAPLADAAPPKSQTPSSEQILQTLKQDTLTAYQSGDWTKTVELARKVLEAEPQNVNALTTLGVALYNLDQNDEALGIFEEIDALEPGIANSRNIALLKLILKKPDAIDTMTAVAEKLPEDAEFLFKTAQALEQARRVNDSIPYYEKAIALVPDNAMYVTALSSILFRKHEYAKAESLLVKAYNEGLAIPAIYINLSLACFNQNKFEDSASWAQQGYDKFKDPIMSFHLGRAKARLGLYEEAETALRVDTQYPVLYIELARVLLMRGCNQQQYATCNTDAPDACCTRESEAVEWFQKSEVGLDEAHRLEFTTYYALALALRGNYEAAEALVRTIFNKVNTEPKALLAASYATTLWLRGDKTSALRIYKLALARTPALAEPDTAATKWLWPPRAVDVLRALHDEITQPPQQAAPQKSSCGCAIAQPSAPSPFALLALAGTSLAIAWRRRKFPH